MHQFLQFFFTALPQYAHQDFYIAGESYGGSWVPSLAQTILQAQRSPITQLALETVNLTLRHVNLKGIMLGNALMSESVQTLGHFDMGCLGPRPLFNHSVCLEWSRNLKNCHDRIAACEVAGNDPVVCFTPDDNICSTIVDYVASELGLNPFDIQRKCVGDSELCYEIFPALFEYMNSTSTRRALGVDKDAPFSPVSWDLYNAFLANAEVFTESAPMVQYLLDQVCPSLLHQKSVIFWGASISQYCPKNTLVSKLIGSGPWAYRTSEFLSMSARRTG